jgi:predicted tellurium resistance membrane protein TerC
MELEILLSLLTLVGLEIVLGIDNVIFISILANKLPVSQQKKAIRYGLVLAMLSRLALLSVINLIMQLKQDLFTILGQGISGKDLILIAGGLFLLYKSSTEIYHKMEGEEGDQTKNINAKGFANVMVQILIMDMVFSIDSIVTAVGMASHVWVMYVAVVISVGIMLFAAHPIAKFVNNHPAFKMLALSFLLLIGFSLMGEGFGLEIPKGYIYFSMFFSLLVDVLQMKMNKNSKVVDLHEHFKDSENKLT